MIDKINGNGSYDFPGSQKRKNPAVRAYENTPGTKEAAQRKAAGTHKKDSLQSSQKDSGVILDLSGKASGRKKEAYAARRKKETSWSDALRKLFTPVVQWLKDFWSSDHSGKEQAEPAGPENGAEPGIGAELENGAGPGIGAGLENGAEPGIGAETSELDAMVLPPLEGADAEGADVSAWKEADEEGARISAWKGTDGEGAGLSAVEAATAAEELKALADQAIKSGNLQQLERFVTQNGKKRLAHNSDLLTYYDRRGKFVEIDETAKHRVLFGDKNVLKL